MSKAKKAPTAKKKKAGGAGLALDSETRSMLAGNSPAGAGRARGVGMRNEKSRVRHDEARVPSGHRRAADDWPVQIPKSDNVEPTKDDRVLFAAVNEAIGIRLSVGDITNEMRVSLRDAYAALSDHAYGEHCTPWLALMIRQRAQAATAERIRTHRGNVAKVEGRIEPPTTGNEIAKSLRANAATYAKRTGIPSPAWLADPNLAAAIDAVAEQVNLGGAGGPAGGKTSERLAESIVEKLKKKVAANSKR